MNKIILASLVAALSGAAGTAQTARAGHEETVAAIGGFIGGVIVGSSVRHDHHHDRLPPPPVHYRPDRHHSHRGGYWDVVTVRTWVPGRWIVSFDTRGRRVRAWEPPHFEHRREKVWVDASRRDRHDRGRYRD